MLEVRAETYLADMGVLSADELLGVLSLDPLATGALDGRRGEDELKPTGVGLVAEDRRPMLAPPPPDRMLLLLRTEEPLGVSSEFNDMLEPVLLAIHHVSVSFVLNA